jgi:hypothetical protein
MGFTGVVLNGDRILLWQAFIHGADAQYPLFAAEVHRFDAGASMIAA